MTATRYRASPQLRRAGRLVLALTPGLYTVVAAVLSLKGGFRWDHFLFAYAACVVLCTPVMLGVGARYLGSTTVDATGIRTRGFVMRRHVRWEDLVSLEVHSMGRGGGCALYAGLGRQREVFLLGVLAMREDEPEFVAAVEGIRVARREAGEVGARR
ncbi:hypothetical protein ABH931_001239 [Streptacidiphilus sp. MAP12-33]|uniref:PH domain-containing protein n=1 Tax=Streptacidiphilus sp. MAP12-33 TaxID=3156266 RepID=UPI0035140309